MTQANGKYCKDDTVFLVTGLLNEKAPFVTQKT